MKCDGSEEINSENQKSQSESAGAVVSPDHDDRINGACGRNHRRNYCQGGYHQYSHFVDSLCGFRRYYLFFHPLSPDTDWSSHYGYYFDISGAANQFFDNRRNLRWWTDLVFIWNRLCVSCCGKKDEIYTADQQLSFVFNMLLCCVFIPGNHHSTHHTGSICGFYYDAGRCVNADLWHDRVSECIIPYGKRNCSEAEERN